MCGEQSMVLPAPSPLLGSPPRVRGTGGKCLAGHAGGRITPACAGNSDAVHKVNVYWQDHPRVCGEQGSAAIGAGFRFGSPPRVRGTDECYKMALTDARITPACAGNRTTGRRRRRAEQDHPRVCGEQKHLHSKIQRPGGSPPRVRGTVTSTYSFACRSRITPACAGNRMARCIPNCGSTDHPRVCGEQAFNLCLSTLARGSPPRVRGTDADTWERTKI